MEFPHLEQKYITYQNKLITLYFIRGHGQLTGVDSLHSWILRLELWSTSTLLPKPSHWPSKPFPNICPDKTIENRTTTTCIAVILFHSDPCFLPTQMTCFLTQENINVRKWRGNFLRTRHWHMEMYQGQRQIVTE